MTAYPKGSKISPADWARVKPDDCLYVLVDRQDYTWLAVGAGHHPDLYEFLTRHGIDVDPQTSALQVWIKEGKMKRVSTNTRLTIATERAAQHVLDMLPDAVKVPNPELSGSSEFKTIGQDEKTIFYPSVVNAKDVGIREQIVGREIKMGWTYFRVKIPEFPPELQGSF